jgi:hypothetical protein
MSTDIRYVDKNNQKKEGSFFCSGLIALANGSTPDYLVFTLPRASLVTRAYIIFTDAAAAGDTLDIKVGSTVVANEISIASTGIASGTVTPTYFATGGSVTIVAGDGAALGGAAEIKVVVEYIETELSEGSYTD